MELSKQAADQIKMKNNMLMTVVALRAQMERATTDLQYGNPASWRVLYHNTLDAYLMMPGVPTRDVVSFSMDAAAHSASLFVEQLAGEEECVPPVAPAPEKSRVFNVHVHLPEVHAASLDTIDADKFGTVLAAKLSEYLPKDDDFILNLNLTPGAGA